MNLTEIEVLARSGESETVEFKKSTANLLRAGETLCGMLNGAGGVVLFGVTDSGALVGQQVSDRTMQEIAEMLRGLEPASPVRISRHPLSDGKELISLVAQPLPADVPYQFKNVAWQRVGPTTSPMARAAHYQLVVDRAHATNRWEFTFVEGYSVDDLDQDEIRRTVREGITAGRLPEDALQSIPDILERLDLAADGRLRKAALVLFGTRLSAEFPQCSLRLARFQGVDKNIFLDGHQGTGHAFDLLFMAMEFLRKHLPIAGHFIPGVMERQDEPLFPIAALREAVVNALIHRSYTDPGGAVSVAIYDDRLEIWSEGSLPSGISVESLKRTHRSRPRNPSSRMSSTVVASSSDGGGERRPSWSFACAPVTPSPNSTRLMEPCGSGSSPSGPSECPSFRMLLSANVSARSSAFSCGRLAPYPSPR